MASILEECTYYRRAVCCGQGTLQTIKELKGGLLQHPYSPDLAPSDFNLLSLLKDHLDSTRFADQAENVLREWLRHQSKDFYAGSFKIQVKRWDKCINVGGDYVEK